MTFEIHSDIEYKYFEVVTKDQRFADYPMAFRSRFSETTFCTYIDKKNWYKDLEAIASWVNNNLKAKDGTPEACFFALG